MELAGAQINANERSGVGGRGAAGERASPGAFRQKTRPEWRTPGPAAPWGPGAHLPSSPLPLPALGSAPPSSRGGGGTRWHRLLKGRGDKSPHSSLWKEMPSSGEGVRGYSVGEGQSPTSRCQPTHLRAAQHPHPSPSPPRLQPEGLGSGEGRLWWFAGREGRGRSPQRAWRRPDGAPPLLPESVPALSHPPGSPTDPVSAVPMGQGGEVAAGIFFFFFLFGNKKVLGLGEILCATAVPRGSPALPSSPFRDLLWERGKGSIWAGEWGGGKAVSPPHEHGGKLSRAGRRSAGRGDTPPVRSLAQAGRAGGPAAKSSGPPPPPPRQPVKASARWLFWRQCF